MKNINFKPDKNSDTPLYIQLYSYFKENITSGEIANDERLPSRRALEKEAKLSKSTIELAYQKLMGDGYAVSRSRSGYFARQSSPINSDISETDFYSNPGISYIMSQNGIDSDSVPRDAVSKLYRDISYDSPDLFEFGHKYGEKSLRKAIAHSLHEMHGISCNPGQIIVGAGTEFLIEQLTHIFEDGTVFGFENPCFARNYIPVKNSGREIQLIDINMDGIPSGALAASGIDVMCLSPDHQFPTGCRMTAEKRAEALSWAEKSPDRYIIEADFDLDFSNEPLPPLFASDKSGSVILLGTFFRTVAPSIRTGFLVLPQTLVERFNQKLPYYICLNSALEQQVIAKYINSGKYRKHTEDLKKIYNSKRRFLIDELEKSRLKPYISLYGTETGTYVIARVENGMTENELRNSAAEHGVKIIPLSACMFRYNELLPKNLFIMGFGGLTADEIRSAVKALERAWAKE